MFFLQDTSLLCVHGLFKLQLKDFHSRNWEDAFPLDFLSSYETIATVQCPS